MRLKAFNLAAVLMAFGAAYSLPASAMTGGGIPVECQNCADATSEAANAILDGIRSQTEAILNGMDFVMRTQVKLDNARAAQVGATEQKIENAYAMEPSLGAKPRTACGQYGAATMRAVAESSMGGWQKIWAKNTQAHNQRGMSLAPGESRSEYNTNAVLETLDKPDVDAFNTLMDDEPIDVTDKELLEKVRTIFLSLLNPYPVAMPSEEAVQRIRTNGSANERETLAQAIVLQKRQEVVMGIADEHFTNRQKTLSTADIKYLIDEMKTFLSDKEKKQLEGNISKYQLDELMATYRVRSSKWVSAVNKSPSSAMALKEGMLVNAEILNQLWEIKKQLQNMNLVQAATESRNISKDGLISR